MQTDRVSVQKHVHSWVLLGAHSGRSARKCLRPTLIANLPVFWVNSACVLGYFCLCFGLILPVFCVYSACVLS
jgi:hypothetical protein